MLIVASLGMPTRHPQQTSNGFFCDLHEAGCGPDTTAFIKMVDDLFRCGLGQLGVEQGTATALREFLPARTAAQEPDAVLAVDFAHSEIVLAHETKLLAFGVDTR